VFAPDKLRNFVSFGAVVALLVAVSLLPPDTSLREIERVGALRACVPSAYPPLVTGDPDQPGVDIELLRAVAEHMGVSMIIGENQAMGRDFNPRNWNLNRAQCQIVAGGVVNSAQTRSFLETGPEYAQTGWAIVTPQDVPSLSGLTVGTLALVSGLDRISLASYLRAEGVTARVMTSPDALVAAIADGTVDAGVTEAMMASRIASENGWAVHWMGGELPRHHLVFGLWKGDITLKRAVTAAFADLSREGKIAAILEKYEVRPIE
jgi:ABC-type amino acid transport substrate-binding protein